MSRRPLLFLHDMQTCCEKVLRYTQGLTQEGWVADEIIFDATLRNLEIIGEAVSHIPDEMRARHPQVEWSRIKAFRNIVAHDYFSIDEILVWNIITTKVPELLAQLPEIIAQEAADEP